jgi:hypothetical protein
MAPRPRTRELPPPLPPGERTVGQLVGEAMRVYGKRFWPALAIGAPVAAVNALAGLVSAGTARLLIAPVGAFLLAASYIGACAIVLEKPLRRRATPVAYAIGVLVFVPFPFLAAFFILPGLVWLALVGLAVPAAFVEELGFRNAFARGIELARAGFVHVLGGFATLALVVFVTQAGLYFVLREYAENTQIVAAILASIVVSPLVFLGAALLYLDQEARLRSRREPRKERDADLPDVVQPHRKRRADAARKSRPSA